MDKLKNCKNLYEIYEVIGEENFVGVAKVLLSILVASPLFWGMFNFGMLLDENSYNAYTYNDKCMSLMFVIFSIITCWTFLYYFGKYKFVKEKILQYYIYLRENDKWLLFWFALAIWTFIPIAFSANILGAFTGATFLSAGYITHIFGFAILGCAAMVTEGERLDLLKSFVWIADVLAVIMLGFEYQVPVLSMFTAAGGVSVYTNENHYGYYLAMACMVISGLYLFSVCIGESAKKRIPYVFSLILNVYVLMINDTLGAYMGVLFASIFMVIIWNIRCTKLGGRLFFPLFIVIAITAISAAGVIPCSVHSVTGNTIGQSIADFFRDIFKIKNKSSDANEAGSRRWGIWKDTVEMIFERPIVGHGPDIMYNKTGRTVIDTPHNEYLECAFYLGIPGLALYLSGLICLLVDKCKKIREISPLALVAAGAAIAYLISAFFGVRKYNDVCFFFMFVGLLVSKREYKDND